MEENPSELIKMLEFLHLLFMTHNIFFAEIFDDLLRESSSEAFGKLESILITEYSNN